MISPKCTKCGKELDEPGALAFSPPSGRIHVVKYHICVECWPKLLGWLVQGAKPAVHTD